MLYLYECFVIQEVINFRWADYIYRNSLRSINRWIVIVQVITKEIRWNSIQMYYHLACYIYRNALKFRKRLLFIVRIIPIKIHWIFRKRWSLIDQFISTDMSWNSSLRFIFIDQVSSTKTHWNSGRNELSLICKLLWLNIIMLYINSQIIIITLMGYS